MNLDICVYCLLKYFKLHLDIQRGPLGMHCIQSTHANTFPRKYSLQFALQCKVHITDAQGAGFNLRLRNSNQSVISLADMMELYITN